jgi:exodeoxyribonuclease VII large subunit
VRAFAACPVPVVSAVGHEQDTPLCDLAADVRASTPTAAARLVVPDAGELRDGLRRLHEGLDAGTRRALRHNRERLARDRERLRQAPRLLLERRRVALDHAGARLQALSPRATLARGYAVARVNGNALRDASSVTPGAALAIELAHGAVDATVTEVRP